MPKSYGSEKFRCEFLNRLLFSHTTNYEIGGKKDKVAIIVAINVRFGSTWFEFQIEIDFIT